MQEPLRLDELCARLRSPAAAEAFSPLRGKPCAVVAFDAADGNPVPDWAPPCPVIGIGDIDAAPELVDVAVASPAAAAAVAAAIDRHPVAAMTLTRLLRCNEGVGMADRLFAESLAYSTLQHGAEFRAWRKARRRRASQREASAPAVLLTLEDGVFTLTLNRPERRNAYSAAMRDALCEALQCVADAPHIARAVLRGAGPCFSAGGDLDEFGLARDAGLTHASRVTRSAAALLHGLRERVEARLHGACIGAGIELPAFVSRVIARADAFFALPEVSMGLIPGAGGTASILSRIGRHRLAYMALTGARINAEIALRWGLIDAIEQA